jgi:hypothetical protein
MGSINVSFLGVIDGELRGANGLAIVGVERPGPLCFKEKFGSEPPLV